MPKKTSHKRSNDILLGPLERPAINWLAARMPMWMTPDALTTIGFLGAFVTGVSYWLANLDKNFLWLASLGFIINWFGDSLDGSLARYRKIERPKFGYFIDHTMDAMEQLVIILGLGLSPYVRFKFAMLALAGYYLVSIYTYIATYVSDVFKLSYGKVGPTEVRVIAILMNVVMYVVGVPAMSLPLGMVSFYDILCIAIGSSLILIFVISTWKQALKLSTVD
ncbi:CDP-alcohol phosphatidyltransferase family protein [candidate division KSB1 bacterium]|nr:CDP-alcohol phosphatidyltransferase family protein [candidate division KSB1 bacterium]NIR72052.1 CDP-alcohol phosphatidyltransferase family protein [candidate division KSB1 bacterium]NIS26565.1 CDP-alcohol phosphatidyltransferase family protein [candidate division KSB1 bacterium]NIT73327.1 CDP-alcohol phosphatidyltransferase family protein [candidate division KSB1 bacterium]NIU27175.1 CDP-alcohol phosphatidyltransferase family protein [candidate division KSB1 bacterium]